MTAHGIAAIAVTLAFYGLARRVNVRFSSPITNPVLTAVPRIIGALVVLHMDYPVYSSGARYISDFLGPATVALGLPLYRHRAILRRHALPALAGLIAGGISAICTAVFTAQWLGLAASLFPPLAIKSATAPIAVQLGPIVAADPGLCAVFAIATGMTGALLGPWVLSTLAIRDPVARGLAYGTISHGIGTAQAATEGQLQGAVSGVAMGCSALVVALLAPRLLPWLV
jgi:putative effector of murein hydrolase